MPARCRIDLTEQEVRALLERLEHDGPGDPLQRVYEKAERAAEKFQNNDEGCQQ